MVRAKKVFIPSTSDIKILKTVQILNSKDLYPLPLGIYKILSGSGEDEYISFREMPTYATLLSYSSKHVSRLIMMLVRNHYLDKIYDEKLNQYRNGSYFVRILKLRRIESLIYKFLPFLGKICSKEYTERITKYMNIR